MAHFIALLLQQLHLALERLDLLLLHLGVPLLFDQQLAVNSDTFDEARGDLHQPLEDITDPGVTLAHLVHLLHHGEVEEVRLTWLVPRRGGASCGLKLVVGHIGIFEQSPQGFAKSITEGKHFGRRYLNLRGAVKK